MRTSILLRVSMSAAACAGMALGATRAVRSDLNAASAATAPVVAYNSQSAGLHLVLPASWHAVDTATGIQVAAPEGAAIPADGDTSPRLVLEIDRSDLLASAIAHDGCCRLVVRDPNTGRIVTDKPVSQPTVSVPVPDDVAGYASSLVAQAPGGARVLGTRSVGSESAAVVAGLPNNGIPSVTLFVKHHDALYTITAMGALQLSPDQESAVASIQFNN